MSDEELHKYFVDHLVWDDSEVKFEMLKIGLLIREHTPQILMRMFMQLPDYGLKPAGPDESKATVVDEFIIPE